VIAAIRRHIPSRLLLISVLVVVGGLTLDVLFLGPKTKELRRLETQRSQLIGQVAETKTSARINQRLTQYLAGNNLRADAQSVSDPTSFLGSMIEGSNLVRLELKAVETVESTNLIQSRFFLRVKGDFNPTLDFVRKLEQGTRLAVIDEIKISPARDQVGLETSINLSIYDSLGSF